MLAFAFLLLLLFPGVFIKLGKLTLSLIGFCTALCLISAIASLIA